MSQSEKPGPLGEKPILLSDEVWHCPVLGALLESAITAFCHKAGSVPCPTTSCLRGVCVKAGTVLRTGWGGVGQIWALHERGQWLKQLPEQESAVHVDAPCRRGAAGLLPQRASEGPKSFSRVF